MDKSYEKMDPIERALATSKSGPWFALNEANKEIASLQGIVRSLLGLCEQAGLADNLMAQFYPDVKNRSGQTRDETAKQARRTMNEARAWLKSKQ